MDMTGLRELAELGAPTITCFFLLFRFTSYLEALTLELKQLTMAQVQAVDELRDLKQVIHIAIKQ